MAASKAISGKLNSQVSKYNREKYIEDRYKQQSSTYKDFSRDTVGDKNLPDASEMDEPYLINTIRYEFSHNNVSDEYKKKWNKRKLDCKMELMKRWTKELQENGIQPKIVFKEPESCGKKKNKQKLFDNDSIFDMILNK